MYIFAERAGFMRSERMVQLVNEYGVETCTHWLHGKGGFVSLLELMIFGKLRRK